MSFLQPWLLLGLPLLFLPIIIHLINQWRYQTKRWGAMMFLLAANRMARGYAKIRQYLILAMRMLAILGLIFAISRPLASGLLGLSGGKTDTTIVLLDRSPSMQERGENGIDSKFTTAKRQLRETLQTLGSNRWVLIDSAQQKPQEFQSVADLFDAPSAQPSSASADLPGMLQTAIEYLKNNRPGQTEIWICSDLRQSDWNSNSNQWSAVRDAFRQFPQTVRLQLISYAENSSENVSIRVTDVRRETVDGSQALSLSLMLVRDEKANQTKAFPVQVEVNGARSELPAEMTGSTLEIKNHRVAVDQNQVRGWGKVSIRPMPTMRTTNSTLCSINHLREKRSSSAKTMLLPDHLNSRPAFRQTRIGRRPWIAIRWIKSLRSIGIGLDCFSGKVPCHPVPLPMQSSITCSAVAMSSSFLRLHFPRRIDRRASARIPIRCSVYVGTIGFNPKS